MIKQVDEEGRLFRIKTGFTNVYLIKNADLSLLIDTGNKGKSNRIIRAIRAVGMSPSDIAYIIVTHTHYDHIGSLKELKMATGAKILVHETEKEHLKKGFSGLPDGTNIFTRVVVAIGRKWRSSIGRFDAVMPDLIISEYLHMQLHHIDIEIVHTPGHTSGSLTCILNKTHAIVGDLAFNVFGTGIFPPFANDQKLVLKSWKKLTGLSVRYIYPGHGKPFSVNKLVKKLQ